MRYIKRYPEVLENLREDCRSSDFKASLGKGVYVKKSKQKQDRTEQRIKARRGRL